MKVGALEMRFDAYVKCQFVTEFININSLADHHIWSTIKTLPATLPEPSSMDRGPRTGVTGAVSASDLNILLGVGARLGPALCRGQRILVVGRDQSRVILFRLTESQSECRRFKSLLRYQISIAISDLNRIATC